VASLCEAHKQETREGHEFTRANKRLQKKLSASAAEAHGTMQPAAPPLTSHRRRKPTLTSGPTIRLPPLESRERREQPQLRRCEGWASPVFRVSVLFPPPGDSVRDGAFGRPRDRATSRTQLSRNHTSSGGSLGTSSFRRSKIAKLGKACWGTVRNKVTLIVSLQANRSRNATPRWRASPAELET
jgi:hypothetical protein